MCNEVKEDTKPKQEELKKLINELKNLIEIQKTITKETIKEHILTVPDEYETTKIRKKNLKKKSELNQKP